MSSTRPMSSWPASSRSCFRRQSLLSLRTSDILGLIGALRSRSLVDSSLAIQTHLLTSSVRSKATWWTDLLDKCDTLVLTSFGNKQFCSVGWHSRIASFKNSSGEKWTPTVTWPSLFSLALATYPLLGVLRSLACAGNGVWECWWTIRLNSGTIGGKCLRGWMLVAARIACKVHSCSAKLGRWHRSPCSCNCKTTCAAIARARSHG